MPSKYLLERRMIMHFLEALNLAKEEYDNLMQAGLDEVAVNEMETAAKYFSDAAYVLNKIGHEGIKAELANKYTVNPYDFAV